MKRSKLLIACGTLILTAAAIFATKANKRFASIATARIGSTTGPAIYGGSSLFTTNGGMSPSQLKVEIYTSGHLALSNGTGSLSGALVTKTNGSTDVYFK
jgi:hypothetical protein